MNHEEISQLMQRNGSLTRGSVVTAVMQPAPYQATLSSIERAELRYSEDAQGDLPSGVLIKSCTPTSFMLGAAEVRFYRAMREQQTLLHLTPVYGTDIDEQAQTACVIMGEFAATPPSEWPIPPQPAACTRAVEALAAFHAQFLCAPFARDTWADQHASGRFGAQRFGTLAGTLIERLGDGLSAARRRLLEHLSHAYPEAQQARFDRHPLAGVVHGDAHFWNILQSESGDVALIDWQLWGADLVTADLAYMIALHWFAERRTRFERDLLWRYADRLGVAADTVWESYRFSVAGLLPRCLLYAAFLPAAIWWPHLERAFNAYDDLGCAELL